MIVVLGRPALGRTAVGTGPLPAGRAGAIAVAAAVAGARVELVGSVGDDAEGDQVAVALGRAGVGHAALLRDPSAVTPSARQLDAARARSGASAEMMRQPRLDAADVELGLRYLSECRVLVIADVLTDDAAAAAAEAAAYHGAALIAVLPPGVVVPPALMDVATVLEDDGAEGDEDVEAAAFAGMVAAYAVALDAGRDPREAFGLAVRAAGSEPTTGWEPTAGWEPAAG